MRIPIRLKMTLAFGSIVLLSLGLTLWTAVYLTRVRYSDFEHWRVQSRARVIASFLSGAEESDWFSFTDSHESDNPLEIYSYPDDEDIFFESQPRPPMMRLMDRLGRNRGHHFQMHGGKNNDHGMSRGHMHENRMRSMPPPYMGEGIILTDKEGKILFDTIGWSGNRLNPSGLSPEPVIRNGQVAAYLYVGQMIPGYNDTDSFLYAVSLATLFISLGVFALAMITGLILTRHIVKPVKMLNTAAEKVAHGKLDTRVNLSRSDELGELSRSFNTMTESLSQAENKRKQMIADSAHELRTPVSLIRTRLELIEEGIYPFNSDTLTQLSRESDRLVQLLDDLGYLADLDISTEEEKESLLVQDLFNKAVQASMPMADSRNILIESQSVDERIYGNAMKLHRLLTNLLSNAIRYAESKITLTVGRSMKQIVIRVEDDGPGIPMPEREKVFNRYYRVDSSRNRDSGGLGLGLSICREIVIAHGGQIHVEESETLGGTAMIMVFPV